MKCLILSGGAEKGIGFLGLIQYLEQYNIISKIETFYGTSIGSIIGLMISIGYTSKELEYIIKRMNIKELLVRDELNLTNFLEKFGFYEPNKIIRLVDLLIKKKTNLEQPTFVELYQKYRKNLIITGSCINDYKCYYFNWKDNPNMRVLDAIRISISIPILFYPVAYENKLFLDGALYNNYPVQHALKTYKMDEILGCFINVHFAEENNIDNLDKFIKVCIRSLYVKFNFLSLELFKECSVILDCEKIYYDFSSMEEIDNFIRLGYNATEQHFKNRFPKLDISIKSLNIKDIVL